ncbi:MAG: nuclear transport factor 2 family protein [Acidobacteriota bacterium]|nr:nuclear transport factor 2 family protein [Acidobacteriota bacterium]
MLTALHEGRRTGPLEPFEKRALIGFALAALAHALLGCYRANLLDIPYVRPLLSAAAILVCGALWLRRFRRAAGGALATPVGLLLVTAGLYSGYSALNAPFVGFLARFCVPLLLVFLGAALLFANQEAEFQIVPFVLAAAAFVLVQVVLTEEARSDGKPIPASVRRGGVDESTVIREIELVQPARSFLEAVNAHDPAAIVAVTTSDHRFIDSLGNTIARETLAATWQSYFRMVPDYRIAVTRWIADGDTVVMLGTASGTHASDGIRPENAWSTPAAWRALIRDGKVAEWQVYADNDPFREIMKRDEIMRRGPK